MEGSGDCSTKKITKNQDYQEMERDLRLARLSETYYRWKYSNKDDLQSMYIREIKDRIDADLG